ncbi:MAG: Uncharacterized protein CEN91_366 [Candidatus Berkelbacteria bacterium Licking1014_85]|uniref:Uncharacterized protein n=1 Tax=Candidatus Berkelbacteria bacterium Licking1014_85 TaxID=2017148 RepID=A0A554LIT9_9BACT|nr:MAG: Uncharacterized protein CEN91_366 [Candidatus Berkelbacteria bacterium Licking1014_85]
MACGNGSLKDIFVTKNPTELDWNNIYNTMLCILQEILKYVSALAVLFILYGAFQYMTSAGNEEKAKAAKNTLKWAIIGTVIVVLSFYIIALVLNTIEMKTDVLKEVKK